MAKSRPDDRKDRGIYCWLNTCVFEVDWCVDIAIEVDAYNVMPLDAAPSSLYLLHHIYQKFVQWQVASSSNLIMMPNLEKITPNMV